MKIQQKLNKNVFIDTRCIYIIYNYSLIYNNKIYSCLFQIILTLCDNFNIVYCLRFLH